MNKLAIRQIIDVGISVFVVLCCSLVGLLIGNVMNANWQEKQWAMLYSVAFIGSISAFFCLIKLSQLINILIDIKNKNK